jgi:hypothetical protein
MKEVYMKLSKHISESREALINALKNIDELDNHQQNYAIITINAAIKEIDTLTKIVSKTEKDNEQQEFFDKLATSASLDQTDLDTFKTPFDDYRLMVLRMEPTTFKGARINGYLETHKVPGMTVPDIIEATGMKYGGGKFQIRIVDGHGKYVKSKTFEVAGLPKISDLS